MRILPEPIIFEWDEGNLQKSFEKHNVNSQEAEEVFSNDPFVISEDVQHSTKREQRFQALGKTKSNRKLFIVFTIRDARIRVISVRAMNKKEVVTYETIKKNS